MGTRLFAVTPLQSTNISAPDVSSEWWDFYLEGHGFVSRSTDQKTQLRSSRCSKYFQRNTSKNRPRQHRQLIQYVSLVILSFDVKWHRPLQSLLKKRRINNQTLHRLHIYNKPAEDSSLMGCHVVPTGKFTVGATLLPKTLINKGVVFRKKKLTEKLQKCYNNKNNKWFLILRDYLP